MKTCNAKVTSVVLSCPRCKRHHDVGVRLVSMGCDDYCTQAPPHDEPDLRFTLPDNCACGEPLDNPKHVLEVTDSALLLFAEGYHGSAA